MPQIFQVLKCYKCLVFQVQQTKKSNKFQCKMCGEKQSIKRHYGLGNGQECRKHVQKLNGIRGEIDESKHNSDNDCSDDNASEQTPTVIEPTQQKKDSKWSDFVEFEDVLDSPNPSTDKMYLNDAEVVLELPRKRQKKIQGRNDQKYEVTKICQNTDSVKFNDDRILDSTSTHNTLKKKNEVYHGTRHPMISLNTIETSQSGYPHHNIPRALEQENPTLSFTPLASNNPNWASFDPTASHENSSKNTPKTEEFLYKESKTIFKPPPLNKNSKWAKFADENEKDEDTKLINDKSEVAFDKDDDAEVGPLTEQNSQPDPYAALADRKDDRPNSDPLTDHAAKNYPQMLFSLCVDDNDLDSYLQI